MKKVVVYQHLAFTSACLELMASALSPCHGKGFLSIPKHPRLPASQPTHKAGACWHTVWTGGCCPACKNVSCPGNYVLHREMSLGMWSGTPAFWERAGLIAYSATFCWPEWLWILEGCCLLDSPSLCDGRWIWGFRARQGHPTIKVLCTWMLPWWTGFTFLTYLKPTFVFLAKGWVLQALSISSCNRY